MRASALAALTLAFACAGAGCRPDDAAVRVGGPDVVVVPVGAARPPGAAAVVFAEVVATRAERERGLMGRERLAPDHGMLFVYPRPTPRTFWMKDCVIPLDIAFLAADGRVEHLATLPPGAGRDDADVPRAGTDVPVLYVLETEAGWFGRHGVRTGAHVDVSAAAAGVQAE